MIGDLSEPERSLIAERTRAQVIVLDTSVLIDGLTGLKRSGPAIPFGSGEASVSADLFRAVGRPRGREIDLGIAECAILREAHLWTLNRTDFRDVPGIRLLWSAIANPAPAPC
jgi:hypothetical protein